MSHPQAAASTGVGTIAVLLVFAAERFGLGDFGAVEGAAAATALIAAGALVGRRGLSGIARLVWRGSGE